MSVGEPPVVSLRKADFWTSLVLLAVAAGMLLVALRMPLEGTYAGVRNAWYVSPALFPILVAVALTFLSGILLANAVRTGGARAALQGLRGGTFRQFWTATEDFWIVAGILGAYIYVLIPRIDFIAATTLLLFALVATYDLGSARGARRVLATFAATALVVAVMALLGLEPAPRSAEAYSRDAFVWGAAVLAIVMAALAVRNDPEARPRLARCIGVSLLTPLIVGAIFKYGLLVPLPNEGLTVELLDRIRYGLPGLLSS